MNRLFSFMVLLRCHIWCVTDHCGRNTHFRQICQFQILYIYIKLKKLSDNPCIYWRNNAKTGNQRKLRKCENKCTLFVVILQVKTLIAIVYRPQEKNMQIILNTLWTFIIIHHFCMATFQSATYGAHVNVNTYLSFRCIY